jgi:ubiquinone/menaquinone biosynthesis C-methylase UbiE
VDVRADALQLPFHRGSVDNIVMIDTLHHLARPFTFLVGAADVLRRGGRLLLVEPFVSAWGWLVYKYLHHERVDFSFQESTTPKEAWDGNAAIPRLVLSPENHARMPLKVVNISYCEWLAYPLSGGFSYRALLPGALLSGLHKLEQMPLFQNRAVSLRVVAVLEKAS